MPPTDYDALRDQIHGLLAEGQSHSRQATAWERVETYWHIGDALLSHVSSRPRADYGRQIIPNLSKDTGLSQSVLWDLLRFRRLLPILPTRRELAWSHYRRLAHLPSQEQFRFYERLADDQHLTVEQLADAIQSDAYTAAITQPLAVPLGDPDPLDDAGALRARFGALYIYKVIASPDPRFDPLWLDVGFHIATCVPLAGLADPRPDQLVAGHRQADGRWTFQPASPTTQRYTYVAWIHRIIDGDTFVGVADPGVGVAAQDLRFRLRGIDTLDLSTLAGRNARHFVTEALERVSFVVVRTHQTDSFGRYLADLRYLPGEPDPDVVRTKGINLNRQLLEERLARPFPG